MLNDLIPELSDDRNTSAATVAVFEANDIILAEIAARLNFDQMKRNFAGIFEPVRGPERDVSRLVLGQHHFLVAAADPGGALHDNPMLGTMVMHLE
jgi:hypothetical protein